MWNCRVDRLEKFPGGLEEGEAAKKYIIEWLAITRTFILQYQSINPSINQGLDFTSIL
jgi:hypothetical protein